MNHILEELKSGEKEVFDYSRNYLYALEIEESNLIERKDAITKQLAETSNSESIRLFYRLELDRINKSLDALGITMNAVKEALTQSPLFNEAKEAQDSSDTNEGISVNPILPDSVAERKRNM
jgi:hypothetical protein